MTSGELIIRVRQELKGLSSKFETEDFDNAISDSFGDTGWAFPLTTDYKILWFKKRVFRHLFFMLGAESAHKFKVDGINLQQRFEHYSKLVSGMDREWEKEYNSIMPDDIDGIAGIKIDSGFVHDEDTGQDLTYGQDYTNSTIITPSK